MGNYEYSRIDKIIDGLYIGDKDHVTADNIKKYGFTAILNVGEDFGLHETVEIPYHTISLWDEKPWREVNEDARLREAVLLLDKLIKDGHTVFVHCFMGLNRSVCTIAGYLAYSKRFKSVNHAIEHIYSCHYSSPFKSLINHMSKIFDGR